MNIIITGASRGIGYETAKLLCTPPPSPPQGQRGEKSKDGNTVVAIARNKKQLENLKSSCLKINSNAKIFPIAFDLEKGNIKKDLLPQIKKHFKTVDVLVNNAATLINKPFAKITREEFEKVYRVNLFSIAELTQSLLPYMNTPLSSDNRASGAGWERSSGAGGEVGPRSHVLNIASMGGIQGSVKFPGLSAYSSSKGALITLTECLAEEYKNTTISFNAIAFGAVQTEMLAEAFPNFKAPITAKEAAEFVAQFSTTGQKYFNGKILQMALSTP